MENNTRESMIFYSSFYKSTRKLPTKIKISLYDAIFDYSFAFIDPNFSDDSIEFTVWSLIKPQLDANRKKYINGCKAKQKQSDSKNEATDDQAESKCETNDNVECRMDNVNVECRMDNDNKEKNKSKKIDKRSYVSLFENNNWFNKVKGSRNKRALRKWLTYLEQRGSAIEVIPPIAWETKLDKMIKYCQKYDLLSAVELAIDSNWKSLSLDRDYSVKVEKISFVREAQTRRYELHQRLKAERESKEPKITFEQYLANKDPNDPKIVKFKEMWSKVHKERLAKESAPLLPEIGVEDE